jgi:hypothetical protein
MPARETTESGHFDSSNFYKRCLQEITQSAQLTAKPAQHCCRATDTADSVVPRIPLHKIRIDVTVWAVERTPSVLQDTMPYKNVYVPADF